MPRNLTVDTGENSKSTPIKKDVPSALRSQIRQTAPLPTPSLEPEMSIPVVNEEDFLQEAVRVHISRRSETGRMEDNEFLQRMSYPLPNGLLIEEVIQQMHGAGRYRVEYRDAKGRIVHTQGDLAIGAAPRPEEATDQQGKDVSTSGYTPRQIEMAIANGLRQAKTQDTSIDQLLQTAKLLKELNGAATPQKSLIEQIKELREVERLIAPKVEVTKPSEPQATDPTSAVLKMLTTNPETVQTIQTRLAALFTGESPIPEKETSWADVFKDMGVELIKNLAPVFAPMLMNRLTAQNVMEPQQEQAQTVSAAAPAPTAPAMPQPPAHHVHIINRILFGIQHGIDPAYVGDEINILCDQDQNLSQLIDQALSVTPTQLLQGLGAMSPQAAQVCQGPNALQWITDLQAYLFNEPQDDAETPPHSEGTIRQGDVQKNVTVGA